MNQLKIVDTVTRFDSSTIANTYNAAGRKDTTTYSPRTAGGSPAIVDNDYYADGQLKSITDTATTVAMGYDKLNQLKTTTNTVAGVSAVTSVVDYDYDPVGNLSSTSISIGNQQSEIGNSYQYDDAERLWRITSKTLGEGVFDYTYKTDNGRIDEIG